PITAAVPNIDNDHLDHYGTKDKIVDAFVEFLYRLACYGRVALKTNDVASQSIKHKVRRPPIWYGIELNDEEADYLARNIEMSASGTSFDLHYKGQFIQRIRSHLIGEHNVSNTLAALAISHAAGLEWDTLAKG